MKVDMHLKDVELSPYTREQIDKKLDKVLTRFPKDVPVKVSIEDVRQSYRAQVQAHHMGRELIGRGESPNILTALEDALGRMDRQFSRVHEIHRRSAAS